MNVLPRLFYFFRTLPVSLPHNDLKQFKHKVLQFIWGDKRPRVNRSTLYTPRRKGGLGLLYLLKYFYAAQVAQLSRFHSQRQQAIWMIMESRSCRPSPISHLMWLPTNERPAILCPTLSLSLDIWDRLSRTHKFRSPHTPLAPFLQNKTFTPGLTPQAFNWWTNKGLMRIADLCDHKCMLSERAMIDKYHMPSTEGYRFTQLTHYIRTLARKGDLSTSTPMEQLCRQYDKIKGHISVVYSILSYVS